jgi:WD40 repeat protein
VFVESLGLGDAEPLAERIVECAPTALALHPRAPVLATGTAHGTVVFWDWVLKNRSLELGGQGGPVRALAFDAFGRRLAVADADSLQVWDLSLGYVRLLLAAPNVRTLAFGSDGTCLAAGADDGTIRVWDTRFDLLKVDFAGWLARLPADKRRKTLAARLPSSPAYDSRRALGRAAAQSGVGRMIVAPQGEAPEIKDALTGATHTRLHGATPVDSVAISPDERYAASGAWDRESGQGDIRLWDVHGGRELRRFAGAAGHSTHETVAFSPEGDRLLSAGNGVIHFWDVATGGEIQRFTFPGRFIKRLLFSKDGRLLLAASESSFAPTVPITCVLYDFELGDPLLQFVNCEPEMAFLPTEVLCDSRYGVLTRPHDRARTTP